MFTKQIFCLIKTVDVAPTDRDGTFPKPIGAWDRYRGCKTEARGPSGSHWPHAEVKSKRPLYVSRVLLVLLFSLIQDYRHNSHINTHCTGQSLFVLYSCMRVFVCAGLLRVVCLCHRRLCAYECIRFQLLIKPQIFKLIVFFSV